jgi:hypothetical protein
MEHLYHRPFDGVDDRRIRKLLLLEADPNDLPKEVIESYWHYKTLQNKLGGPISSDGIIRILERSKVDIPMPLPPSLAKELLGGEHKSGIQIEVIWKHGHYKECTYLSANKREILVVMDGDDRRIPINRTMRLAKPAELVLQEDE